MDSWRASIAAGLACVVVVACAAGCASPTRPASGNAATNTPHAAPNKLATAGPAPGPAMSGDEDDEGDQQPAAAALAAKMSCVELEPQAHIPAVDEQLSCRTGTERAYVMTFRSTTARDAYLAQAPQLTPRGFNVLGPTFVVHVPDAATATTVATVVNGLVRANS